MLRQFVFYNNIIGDRIKMVPTEFSVLGYFDGLRINSYGSLQEFESFNNSYCTGLTDDTISEKYDHFELTGFRKESDDWFWKDNNEPYIFVSCLRLKTNPNDIDRIIREIEKIQAICYRTIDNSDLIVCYRSSSYLIGVKQVRGYDSILATLDRNNGIYISFSAVVVAQNLLDEIYQYIHKLELNQDIILQLENKFQIINEKIDVLFRLNVKKWNNINDFVSKLISKLQCKGDKTISKTYIVLGNTDAIVMLYEIDSILLLSQYSNDGMLTHNNELYKNTVYNIQSEILADY